MTLSARLGAAYRRLAANSSVRHVRHTDLARTTRHGATAAELNDRFRLHVETIEQRVTIDPLD